MNRIYCDIFGLLWTYQGERLMVAVPELEQPIEWREAVVDSADICLSQARHDEAINALRQ